MDLIWILEAKVSYHIGFDNILDNIFISFSALNFSMKDKYLVFLMSYLIRCVASIL